MRKQKGFVWGVLALVVLAAGGRSFVSGSNEASMVPGLSHGSRPGVESDLSGDVQNEETVEAISGTLPEIGPTGEGDHGGASARCVDGTLSYSKHHSGTCSRHGGVAEWYR